MPGENGGLSPPLTTTKEEQESPELYTKYPC